MTAKTIGDLYTKNEVAGMIMLTKGTNSFEEWVGKLKTEYVEPKMKEWQEAAGGVETPVTADRCALYLGRKLMDSILEGAAPMHALAMIGGGFGSDEEDEVQPRSKMN